ncbi:MAG: MFS transporter [Acidobacteria bacterium]|nr:MFS transporter [Acidobacteriota bacterium]MBV9474935.1 MFS transporter [Acidobacteriota bacterium]
MPSTADRAPAYSWYALAVLTTVYVLNFLDRTLIYILFTPIKAEMHFSDVQLALLGATSFAIFYTLLGIPFGRLADRVVRKNLIAVGLATWSLFSGLTGFANSFWTLFLCRVMVGVGEATLGPAALSLLSDYFPPRMRATVQSVYSSAIAVGGGIAYFFGGVIAQRFGWRWAFYLLGFPGLALALLVFFLREEPRGRTETVAARYTASDWRVLFRSPALWCLYLGYGFFSLASNNLGIWVPTFFVRVHHMSVAFIGQAAGILALVVGVPVTILGGYYSDRFSRMAGGGRMAFTAAAALASIPLWLGLLWSNNMILLVLLNMLLYGLALMWVAPAAADIHDIAGPHLRGLGIGIFFSAANVMAYLVGAPLIGKLNDTLGVATDPGRMRLALLVCPVAALCSALLLFLGSRARSAKAPVHDARVVA